jgi:hypothetical protein
MASLESAKNRGPVVAIPLLRQQLPNDHVKKVSLQVVPDFVKKKLEDKFLLLRRDDRILAAYSVVTPRGEGAVPMHSYLLPCNSPTKSKEYLSLYVIDVENNKAVGYGRMYHDPMEVTSDTYGKPTVVNTETLDDPETGENYKRRGYGRRRLELMNAYSLAAFNEALHSDIEVNRHPYQTRIWLQLEKEGRAHQYQTPFGGKFVFNTPKDTIEK